MFFLISYIIKKHLELTMIAALFDPVSSSPRLALPIYGSAVPAGFPSPADDYLEQALDLNDYLINDAAATFMVRVAGDSMAGAGIGSGDMLVVDKVNREYGRGTLRLASEGVQQGWAMRQEKRSPRWTTCWDELPVVR